MAGEIKNTDAQEIKNPNAENYKEIKPQNDNSYSDSKDYWNSKYETSNESSEEKRDDANNADVNNRDERVDDDGNVYRVGNELVPNNEYKINGYEYKTDDKGRIVEAGGKLQVKDHDGYRKIKDSKADVGKGDEKETDDKGHLIGDQFNGSNGLENLVAQDSKINQGDYKNFENQLAQKVNTGSDVRVSIKPEYSGDSHRPDAIVVNYSIDGKQGTRIFPNP